MKSIHFICKREGIRFRGLSSNKNPDGLSSLKVSDGERVSGFWDIKESDAQELINGLLFLHETKSRKASFAGKILDYEVVTVDKLKRSRRIAFKLKVLNAHSNPTSWPKDGSNHAMAYCSGVVAFNANEKNKALSAN